MPRKIQRKKLGRKYFLNLIGTYLKYFQLLILEYNKTSIIVYLFQLYSRMNLFIALVNCIVSMI